MFTFAVAVPMALVGLVANHGMFAFRDIFGIRPLCYGSRETEAGTEYAVASESVVLDSMGFGQIKDLQPGEALFVDNKGKIHLQQCAAKPELVPCIFEHVYFARPDSMIDDISVYKCRLRMGEKLAEKVLRLMPDHDIDVVIPIPDTSRVSAQSRAETLGVKLREGFMEKSLHWPHLHYAGPDPAQEVCASKTQCGEARVCGQKCHVSG